MALLSIPDLPSESLSIRSCLYLLVWIQSSPTSFCPLGTHGVHSFACADVNIWSGNEKEKSCWRDGRGGGRKMGEERCESKRETTQVSSSVGGKVVRWKGGRKVERTYVDILFS